MMHDFIFLLGREPDLSIAELRSLFGEVTILGDFALIKTQQNIVDTYAKTLGGTIKIGRVVEKKLKKTDILSAYVHLIEQKIVE